MPRRVGRQFRSGVRRLTAWSATAPETQWIALAAGTSVIDSTFTTAAGSVTVVRSRGLLSVVTDQEAADEQPFGAVGIAIVSDQAVAAGVGSVPSPYTEPESDFWLLHQFWSAEARIGDGTGFARLSQVFELDSKAMRKVSDDETLILMMENGNATDGILYRLDMRFLVKLP